MNSTDSSQEAKRPPLSTALKYERPGHRHYLVHPAPPGIGGFAIAIQVACGPFFERHLKLAQCEGVCGHVAWREFVRSSAGRALRGAHAMLTRSASAVTNVAVEQLEANLPSSSRVSLKWN